MGWKCSGASWRLQERVNSGRCLCHLCGEIRCRKYFKFFIKVDVYSFALVMYEVLSLSKPYVRLTAENFHDAVVKGGARPPLNKLWPVRINKLLGRMWSTDVAMRPSSKEVVGVLGDLLRGDDVDLYPTSRYSYGALTQRLFNTTSSNVTGGG
mmetsp:Transcript_9504/g.14243  ORF Transcript_9504/g.14243 Transcript_9504/m.14243 type:complete len:153 (-) Transcript_9504:344-802(-)